MLGGAARAGIGALDLERPRPHYFDPAREDRTLEQLDAAPRASDLGLDLDRSNRDRAKQLIGHPSQAQALRRGESLERPHEQRGRGAAV